MHVPLFFNAFAEVQVLANQRQTYAQQANENTMVKKVPSVVSTATDTAAAVGMYSMIY
jgi:hypothetical protein